MPPPAADEWGSASSWGTYSSAAPGSAAASYTTPAPAGTASYTTPAPASYTTPAPGPAPMDVAYTSAAPAPAATPLPAFARPGVVVTVNNEQGVISHTLPDGTADVRFSSGRVATVAGSDMAAVHPASNGDRVMMVDSGMTGTITSMDDVGVLVSFGDDVRMVDNLSMLVRVE